MISGTGKLPGRAFTGLLLAALSCSSQSLNSPFIHPFTGDSITAGTTYNITWTVILGARVNIQIKNTYSPISTFFNGSNCPGDLTNFQCSQIATDVQNSGVYQWAVPSNAPSSGFYTFDLYVSNGGLSGTTHYTTGNFFISQPQSGSGASATGNSLPDTSTSSSSRVSSTSTSSQKLASPISTGSVSTSSGTVGPVGKPLDNDAEITSSHVRRQKAKPRSRRSGGGNYNR